MRYLKNIKLLYINIFFQNFIFAYVIERLYWQNRDMTVTHVVYTEIIYALTIVLLEIPTGVWADKWSRKNLIIIGSLCCMAEIIILIYAHTFWHFALAVMIAGVATSMRSGSKRALVYDSLKYHGMESQFEKVIGQMRVLDVVAAIGAALIGGYIATQFGFGINYWLSLGSFAIASVATWFLIEPPIMGSDDEEEEDTKGYVKRALQFFRNHGNVALVVMTGILIGVCINYVDEFWQIYLNEISVPVLYFGVFSALISFAAAPGSMLAHKLKGKVSYRVMLIILIITFTVALLISALCPNGWGIMAIILIGFIGGIAEPLVAGYLHHRTSSDIRATVDSFYSLVERGLSVGVGLLFGYCSTYLSIFTGYGALGLVCMLYIIVMYWTMKKVQI